MLRSKQNLLPNAPLLEKSMVVSIVRNAATALDGAHRNGQVHQNLTPADIMLSDPDQYGDRTLEIINFDRPRSALEGLTSGAPPPEEAAYLSREEILGLPTTPLSNQYSLAVIAYELLYGTKPFNATNLPTLFYEICTQEVRPPSPAESGVNQQAADVLARALAQSPESRFSTCTEFANALTVALQGHRARYEDPSGIRARTLAVGAAAALGVAETRQASRPERSSEPPHPEPRLAALPPEMPAPEPEPPPRRTNELPPRLQRLYGVPEEDERPASSLLQKAALFVAVCLVAAGVAVFAMRWRPAPRLPVQVLDTQTAPASPPPGTPAASKPDQQQSAQQAPAESPAPESTASVNPSDIPAALPNPPQPATASPAQTLPNLEPSPKIASRPSNPRPAALPFDGTVQMELVTDPPLARVVIDGDPRKSCATPCTVPLKSGRHTLTANLSGYMPARQIFNVPQDKSIFMTLRHPVGTLLVTSNPAGATVFIDAQMYGKTPVTVKLAAGDHRLEVVNGSQRHQETINIEPDELHARSFTW